MVPRPWVDCLLELRDELIPAQRARAAKVKRRQRGCRRYKNNTSQVQAFIEKYLDIPETNEVTNQLAALGVYAETSETTTC